MTDTASTPDLSFKVEHSMEYPPSLPLRFNNGILEQGIRIVDYVGHNAVKQRLEWRPVPSVEAQEPSEIENDEHIARQSDRGWMP